MSLESKTEDEDEEEEEATLLQDSAVTVTDSEDLTLDVTSICDGEEEERVTPCPLDAECALLEAATCPVSEETCPAAEVPCPTAEPACPASDACTAQEEPFVEVPKQVESCDEAQETEKAASAGDPEKEATTAADES